MDAQPFRAGQDKGPWCFMQLLPQHLTDLLERIKSECREEEWTQKWEKFAGKDAAGKPLDVQLKHFHVIIRAACLQPCCTGRTDACGSRRDAASTRGACTMRARHQGHFHRRSASSRAPWSSPQIIPNSASRQSLLR